MATVAFDVKEQLVAKSKANPAFVDLLNQDAIWDSSYAATVRPKKVLWFGEIGWTREEPASLGRLRREEEFDVRFGIEIWDSDPTQTEANAKAKAILADFEEMMRDPRALGIPNLTSIGIVPVGIGEGPDGTNGRTCLFAGQIHVVARI